MTVSPSRGRVRTRSRAPRRIAIVLISLLVLLLVVDRGGEYIAENLAASKLQSSQNLPSKPDVEIDGFPFLTQFASGEYDHVVVTSTNVPIGSGNTSLTLSKVRANLNDMTVTDNFSTVHVDRADAAAVIEYSDLSKTLGVDVRYVGDGLVRASKTITILGQTITPTVTAKAQYAGGALSFVATKANGLGPLVGELVKVTSEVFGSNVPLQGIPFDVSIRQVSLTSEGLRLELVGSDITYSR